MHWFPWCYFLSDARNNNFFFQNSIFSLRSCRKSRPYAKVIWQFICCAQEDLWEAKCQYQTFYLHLFLKGPVLDGGLFIFFTRNWIIGFTSELGITEGFLYRNLIQNIQYNEYSVGMNVLTPNSINRSVTGWKSDNISDVGI